MNTNLEDKTMSLFEDLCKVPRPSGHMVDVRKFLLSWAESEGFEAFEDKIGNIIVKVPATAGKEKHRSVCLQAHMDMVPQTADGVTHDWTKDPIVTERVYENGVEWLKAKGTSLGSDDGIGVAAAMAVATSASHGPLELLFTTDEETSMTGALGLDASQIDSELMINLDSEQEGEICVGGAGGTFVDCEWKFVESDVEEGDVALRISLSGLKGGHSGMDIHLQRANAVKAMARVLRTAVKELEARLVSFDADNLRNAIPSYAQAVITVPDEGVADMIEYVRMAENELKEIYAGVDDGLRLDIEAVDTPAKQIPEELQDDIINAICGAPDGVCRHFENGDIEASLNHSFIITESGKVTLGFLLRSARAVTMAELIESIESLYSMAGASVKILDRYVEWTPNFKSKLLETTVQSYESLFNDKPRVYTMHAGLECGIIADKKKGLDIVSIGPTLLHPHSTGEKLDVASVGRFTALLAKVLSNIR
ncbi:MAG: beta-Ala-His dipeptidase [Paludibacteraceae bacterium]|nr:beta-Ala-His dipeptidase [Paludibacteraceae bacterium]